jgi:hypothetical protein
MSFTNWGFIYLGTGEENPAVDRAVLKTGPLTTTVVAVPDAQSAINSAVELVDNGAQSIELCGAFGPKTVAEVIEATSGRVPVGGVTYGAESMVGLAALFAPANS